MLGTAFEVTGARGLSRTPLKRDYAGHDWRRIARLRGVTYNPAPTHPPIALPTMRAFYALDRRDPAAAVRFAKAAFQAAYVAGRDVGDLAVVLELSGLTAEAVSDSRDQGTGQGPVREGCRPRCLRLALVLRRRRALLGLGPPAYDR
jgi:2-hydroxychromene-2-carboxylate isomerase